MNDPHDNAQDDRDALEKHAGSKPLTCEDVGCPCVEAPGPKLTHIDGMTEEVLDEDAPAGSGWDKERHCATDLRGADWAGRKLREAQEQIAVNDACARAEQAELLKRLGAVTERLEAANRPFEKTAEYMENALKVFAETHREEVLKGLRTKSRLLPSGVRIGWETKGGHLRLKDGDEALKELMTWADRPEMPDKLCRRPPPEPALVEIKAFARAQTQAWTDPSGKRQVRLFTPPGMERAPIVDELYVSTGVDPKEEP